MGKEGNSCIGLFFRTAEGTGVLATCANEAAPSQGMGGLINHRYLQSDEERKKHLALSLYDDYPRCCFLNQFAAAVVRVKHRTTTPPRPWSLLASCSL